jgi:hypothetical protein
MLVKMLTIFEFYIVNRTMKITRARHEAIEFSMILYE